ncbi:unnamed protein product [Blepharisma stoltei]|uniref:Uncharacterized protein n=1 Tax=Blepharisma stoltei TaxID=1481888 RepID=A0AAU9K3N3_9CILI|nr:unnamed protein product [Blepharisma stoltei]
MVQDQKPWILIFFTFYSLFSTSVASFGIDDTETLKYMNISASPSVFGFSVEKGEEIFPPYFYPRCEDKPKANSGSIYMDFSLNTLEINCTKSKNPFYVLGPHKFIKVANPTESKDFLTKQFFNINPVPIEPHHEFAVASCFNKEIVNMQYLSPRFQGESYYETLNTIKTLNLRKTIKKPMTILFLVPDSFSRRHFFRKLTSTVSYLNELNFNSEWSAFDFKLHNIIGADTSENMMRVFGHKWVSRFLGNQDVDFFKEEAIWFQLKKLGFMTLWGADSCPHNVPKSMGRIPQVDHCLSSFYCAFYIYGDYRAAKQLTTKQRCIGPHMSHYYLMEYSKAFNKLYPNANQWIYNHFDAAHEGTGQHAQALDYDLKEYIKYYIENVSKTHEVVIVMAADHGMRYGEFLYDSDSIQEHRLPALFIVARNEFLKSMDAQDNLLHNTLRLNSKPDLKESMLFLAHFQNNLEFKSKYPQFYSLFSQKIPDGRTCRDAEIPIWYCSSYLPEPINIRSFDDFSDVTMTYKDRELKRTVNKITDSIVYYINSEVFTMKNAKLGSLCMKINLNEIIYAGYKNINGDTHLFKIMFTIMENKRAQYDTWSMVSFSNEINQQFETDKPYIEPIAFMGQKMHLQILGVIRTDKYGGDCEMAAREIGINPQFCICNQEFYRKLD